jgi:ribosomal 30S subunit maturation factor RimM
LTSVFKNLQEDEIMQNDLNQSNNSKRIETIRIETNSSFDELKKNFDASKMLISNLNERFEKAKRQFQNRLKFQKFKKLKTKIRTLKRENNEIVEEATKKIESKEIEFFLSDLMQSISILERVVQSIVSS